jgi:hypothetical protein
MLAEYPPDVVQTPMSLVESTSIPFDKLRTPSSGAGKSD